MLLTLKRMVYSVNMLNSEGGISVAAISVKLRDRVEM